MSISRTRQLDIPSSVVDLCKQLRASGYQGWIVGGCIRNLLLGKPVEDWDIATTALPEEVQKVFRRVIPTGIAHGTVTVLWQGGSYEVTTLRGEGAYSDGRRPDSVFFVKQIEDDLARRDFTVNAVAYDPIDARCIDPFHGIEDMERRVIRAVGVPAQRFEEDGLRVLRAARFVAALEFTLDAATEAAIAPSLETFRKVSNERVRDEWMKAMKARTPSVAFEVMRRCGMLEHTFPELLAQVDCEQNRWHRYDVWNHTMHCLDSCKPEPVLRMAALLHDVGKPRTRQKSDETGDYTFYHHERVGADMADRWLRDYRFSNQDRDKIVHLVRHHLVCYSKEWSDAAVRRFLKRVGTDLLADLLDLARADAHAKGRPVDDELEGLRELEDRTRTVVEQGNALSTRDLAVTGEDIMKELGIPPGRQVGDVLRFLLERVLEEPELNTRESLLALTKKSMQ